MKKLMMAAALAALACGCVTVNKNDGGDACLKPKICKDCVHEKYTVAQQPVTATCTVIGICGLFTIGDPEVTHISDQAPCEKVPFGATPKAKNGAYSKACDAAKCDSIVGTRYTVTRQDYFVYETVTAEISGYPAKLTGVELISAPCCCKPGCDKK